MAIGLANIFGILGNIVSFLVYLSPLPTFYKIYKKKSSEGFQSYPYAVALFSANMYLYYAFLKKNSTFLITINTIGTVIEAIYIVAYLVYGTKRSRIWTMWVLVGLNVVTLGVVVVSTQFLASGHLRVTIVGWMCAIFSVCVFASPLCIMRLVIKTKSVEYMPFSLSFFLTLCAIIWFLYGFLIRDYYIATPNVLGFAFGMAQMVLYAIYRKGKAQPLPSTTDNKIQDISFVVDMRVLEMLEKKKTGVMEFEKTGDNDTDEPQNDNDNDNHLANNNKHEFIIT